MARIYDTYLDKKDLEKALPKEFTDEDSITYVNNYINRWATKQLLLNFAKQNLPQEKQEEFDAMVREYREELYTEMYKDMIIASKMDTTITATEVEDYFENNKESFKLNEELLKLRYIKLEEDYADADDIKEQFEHFDKEAQEKLNRESFKFEDYFLNDSMWISSERFTQEALPSELREKENVLKKDKFIQHSDSLSLYLIFVKDVLEVGDQAPLDYVKPTLKQILLNKKKLQFAKEFEKNITKDALEDNHFEIYD